MPLFSSVIACGVLIAVAAADTVTLKSGAIVQGSILKRNDQKVWIDVGPPRTCRS